MMTEANLAAGVGFRHVIEDGISVLSNGKLDPERRNYVVQDLTELLQRAVRGADLVNRSLLFVRSEERTAFDAFSLLDRYLGRGVDPQWRDKLPATENVFVSLKADTAVSDEERSTAIELLSELLSKLQRQGGMGIPAYPEEITIFK